MGAGTRSDFAANGIRNINPSSNRTTPATTPSRWRTVPRYGKGAYIFTAYSWFRELPAGVPGAYRLFANLLSAGKAAQ